MEKVLPIVEEAFESDLNEGEGEGEDNDVSSDGLGDGPAAPLRQRGVSNGPDGGVQTVLSEAILGKDRGNNTETKDLSSKSTSESSWWPGSSSLSW